MALVGVFMVLVAHGHYTIDILIAYYITTRLFWTYHTLVNNSFLIKVIFFLCLSLERGLIEIIQLKCVKYFTEPLAFLETVIWCSECVHFFTTLVCYHNLLSSTIPKQKKIIILFYFQFMISALRFK